MKKQPAKHSAPLMNIGVPLETVKEARATLMEIINAPHVGEQVKLAAIDGLKQICKVSDVNITGCTFSNS